MVVGNQDTGGTNSVTHPSGIPQDKIDNIMSGIANTGDVKMNNHRKKLRQRFDIIKKLGQGTYGKVQLGINKETGQEVAIKTIKKCKIEAESDLVRIRREVQIMSSVQHPNIIHIYEVFENREKMVLVMEFAAGGELYDYLSERKVLSEEEARRIFRQVSTAVYYCHKHKICHRDLKLENILLDEHGNAKIADFGLSNVFDDQRMLATFCGSPLYASPEIVEGTPYHGPEVDCWSLGVLLYTLVYGSMPFDGSNFKRLVKQISQGDYYEPKKPSRASSLIREMLTVCPRKRATIEQICSHWWVNENDNVSCLELAEDLANQTPVRLDVLLSLTPAAITADQLVVPSADGGGASGKSGAIPRSHSVGSIRDMGPNTEAERRILDMVAAGGEAALMPSPTRTITPAQSPIQTKRKLENTVSTENATGVALNKKEKPGSTHALLNEPATISTVVEEPTPMDTDTEDVLSKEQSPNLNTNASRNFSVKDMKAVGDLCEQLIQDNTLGVPTTDNISTEKEKTELTRQLTVTKLDTIEDVPEKTKGATKVIKKFVNKHKTADLVNVIGKIDSEESAKTTETTAGKAKLGAEATTSAPPVVTKPFVRKCSLQDETPLSKFNTERRKSRILETAEKFQQMNANNNNAAVDKPKKLVIPGVSVGNFKKEYERKASTTGQQLTAGEQRALEEVAAAAAVASDAVVTSKGDPELSVVSEEARVEASDSKASVSSFSLEDARRSMENSIALIRQAQSESSKDVNSICAKTENICVSEREPKVLVAASEREQKLKNARAIIGNAIQPASATPGTGDSVSNAPPTGTMKTSTASITLKSATLPRRKTAKSEIQLDIKAPIVEKSGMRFTTEMQHPVADLRSAPPREGPVPYSPITSIASARASSLEPKEHIIHIQKPPSTYMRTTSNTTTRSDSLSRQSTNDSESDTTTTNMSQSTIAGSSQPIKKSPREFIIPIAVEGGGFITPREGSIEPSESGIGSSRSTFTRLRPTRRIGSLLSETGVDDSSPFQKLRTSSSNRDGDDDSRFTLHKLRSSRPVKKASQDNDSQSSGEEDDDDGFEILTAENLFSTLLQRVRALTNRMNVNNDITSGFPSSSRILSNMRQAQSPFWNQDPFGSRLNNAANSMGVPWRHSMSRDLGSDMESMFSRTGATLPRGKINEHAGKPNASTAEEPLDLADLDLSRLRLSKTDLETLSNIAPGLPKCFQEQLLAKLPPTQARKLSRTLSVQTSQNATRIYKRSQSSSRASTNQNSKTENVKETEIVSEELKQEVAPSRHNMNMARGEQESRDHTSSMGEDFTDKECCALYTSEINEKYKYYSPYVNKASRDATQLSGSASTQKLAGSEIPSTLGRPPSGRLSPSTSAESTGSVAKRTSHRRISRLLRADMDHPLEESPVESPMSREAIDPTRELLGTVPKQKDTRHVRNKSMDAFSERGDNSPLLTDATKANRRSLSRPRDAEDEQIGKHELADKILQELQLLSSMRSQQEQRDSSVLRDVPSARSEVVGLPVVKKIKKLKISEKSTESSTEAETKATSTVVKKVKKVIKKSDFTKTSTSDDIPGQMAEDVAKVLETGLCSPKKVSKLKRPKSYPMKDSAANGASSEVCTTLSVASCTTSDSKETTKQKGHTEALNSGATHSSCPLTRESRLLRPKSYPASKLNAPKELKKTTRPSPSAGASLEDKPLLAKSDVSSSSTPNATLPDNKPQIVEAIPSTTLKKSTKVTKKSKLSQPTAVSSNSSTSNTTSSVGDDSKESSPAATIVHIKEKVLEKKPGKGLLYAIGQKFEKFRASATSNSCANIPTVKKPPADGSSAEKVSGKYSFVKKTKSLGSSVSRKATDVNKPDQCADAKQKEKKDPSEGRTAKGDKRSRIDVMIRNLRERSVPRSQPAVSTESNYIKRAVSVEEMPGTFNRKSVNKVLGLFKRYEKDTNNENRVRNARSASNIQGQLSEATPIYQNADAILKFKGKCGDVKYCSGDRSQVCRGTVDCNCDFKSPVIEMPIISPCPECIEHVAASLYQDNKNAGEQNQTGNRDKRKGLMLELMKPERVKSVGENANTMRSTKLYQQTNDNEIYSNLPPYPRPIPSLSNNGSTTQAADNLSNNNNIPLTNNNNSSSLNSSQTSGYRLASVYESNQNNNIASPSFDNIANYSSDSRSYQEDCASTSTFRSPTEEPELYFDNWSVCSEDNYRMHGATPSPTVSRLSRTSQVSSPTRRDGESSDPNESIVDRIRRRSFYCRFNEKKPKRTSSIVGPNAVREYYREQHAATKTRSSNKLSTGDRERSPDITQEFFRPLKLSPIGTELKPPVYKSTIGSTTHDYSTPTGRSRKSLSDIRTPPSPSGLTERRFGSFAHADNDLLTHNTSILPTRYKSSTGAEPNKSSHAASYYSTYNPKRRFSYNINGSTPPSGSLASTSGHFEGYATMGRRPIRAYDHRTLSLLEPSSSSSYRHESNTPVRDYTTSLSRSNSRYRTTSASRSPTNI